MVKKKCSTLGYFIFVIQLGMMLSSGLTILLFYICDRFGLLKNNGLAVSLTVICGVSFELLLACFLSRTLVKNLLTISNAAQKVARGDFSVRLNEEQKTQELQTVAQSFNKMANDLSRTELMRNDFIQNVSHEIKTPIAKIEGYANLLNNASLSEEKRKSYIETILLSSRRLSSLTGDILLLSRLENCEENIPKEWFSLDEQLRESVLFWQKEWTEKHLTIEIDETEILYKGNKQLLYHVWQNVISNAVKFTRENGAITLSTQNSDGGVTVTIRDDGIGMDEETLRRIFEKFYQGDRSRAEKGNGLGLTLAKRIVDLHGGCISAKSKQNEGTIFTIFLPSCAE